MDAAAIIEALGDTLEVSQTLSIGLPAVSNWKARGIPASRMLDLYEMAQRKGLKKITIKVLRAASAQAERTPRPLGDAPGVAADAACEGVA